jgi:hypothetical protein
MNHSMKAIALAIFAMGTAAASYAAGGAPDTQGVAPCAGMAGAALANCSKSNGIADRAAPETGTVNTTTTTTRNITTTREDTGLRLRPDDPDDASRSVRIMRRDSDREEHGGLTDRMHLQRSVTTYTTVTSDRAPPLEGARSPGMNDGETSTKGD